MASDKDNVELVKHEEAPAELQLNDVTVSHSTTDPEPVRVPLSLNNNKSPPTTNVTYCANGKEIVTREECVVRDEEGGRVIITPRAADPDQPVLTEKEVRQLRIFAILAVIFFFPLGIPALIFAQKTKTEYHLGMQKNDLSVAKKMSKTCERFVIGSLVIGLLSIALIFAIVEKSVWGHHHPYSHYGTYGKHAP